MRIWIIVVFCILIFVIPVHAIGLTANLEKSIFARNETIGGSLELSFDEYPSDLTLRSDIGGKSYTSNIVNLIKAPGNYTFIGQPFKYNISIHGRNEYTEYPSLDFYFKIRVDSTTGSNNTPWYEETQSIFAFIDASERLKYIYNASNAIGMPEDINMEDNVWSVSQLTDERIESTMRQACGNQPYGGYFTSSNGWVNIKLNDITPVLNGNDATFFLGIDFDGSSLSSDRTKFGGNGGVFKNGQYLSSPIYVEWNEEAQEITIHGYDYQSQYEVNFLPPNGPLFCAYTNYSRENSFDWDKEVTINEETTLTEPYEWVVPLAFIKNQAPACPTGTDNCNKTLISWDVYKVYDPNNEINFSFDLQSATVRATTEKTDLEKTERESINISNLSIKSDTIGNQFVRFSIYRGDSIVFSVSKNFSICSDFDKDGFCIEQGDCNDFDSNIYPNATELCNFIDDNCDGNIDEGFSEAGKRLNDACGVGICAGYWTCKADGTGIFCNSTNTGVNKEICNNGIDDDCDGEIDEEYDIVNGKPVESCVCKSGDTRACGTDIGACGKGYQVCVGGVWSQCINNIEPTAEVCNGIDDNCDGIIDNIENATSVSEARCACFSGKMPKEEVCNGIDDDCDEEIDEDSNCCLDGDTRTCGTDTGECKQGISKCVGGMWGDCEGSINPAPEVCYDQIDNDCDGEIDEGCIKSDTCTNGKKDLNEDGVDCGSACNNKCIDMFPFMIMGVLIIIIILIFAMIEIKGMFGLGE